ncbi:MAG: M28 family peptidase [Clostridia bacterium]|nr:M28 family peptidase [Deltaproteobacteria bacterium]
MVTPFVRAIAERAFVKLATLQTLVPRYCGTEAHKAAQLLMREWAVKADSVREHTFDDDFFGVPTTCVNVAATLRGDALGRIMLVTHYDTRPVADCDPVDRSAPVPGANDGGCGPALFAELIDVFKSDRNRPTIDLVFLDAEDWHALDGKVVALGARKFVEALEPADFPDACLEIDMIAGRTVMLDVDVSCQQLDSSYALTLELFQIGRAFGLESFNLAKKHPYKWIEADHLAFQEAGIASAIFMDTDYPEWHTRADTIEACDPRGLADVTMVVLRWIYGEAGLARLSARG